MNPNSMIDGMLDPTEHILWRGQPVAIPYIFSVRSATLFALFWGIMEIPLLGSLLHRIGNMPFFFSIGFYILLLMPVWVALGAPILRAVGRKYVDYCITDRRIYIQSGIIGRDIKSLEYTELSDLQVNVGFWGSRYGCGTIILNKRINNNGNSVPDKAFFAVENPYEVYKLLKELSLDVKTDIYYPNAMRPTTNPGYPTQLDDTKYPKP